MRGEPPLVGHVPDRIVAVADPAVKVAVTGGGGYLGSTLVPMLLAAGYEVAVLDNFMYQENSLAGSMHDRRLSVTVGDIRDEAAMRAFLRDVDVVIPLAAVVGAPACARDPVAATSINRDAVIAMLDMVSPQQHVIMPTTNSAYGQGQQEHHCDETSPLHPLSQYAREKVEVEQRLMGHSRATSLRLATVFGMSPRMRLDLLVNDFVSRALRDRFIVLFESGFYRNYIHVRDVSRLFLFALANLDRMSGEVYNAGLSSANLTKAQLCERIQAQVPGFVVMEAPMARDPDQRNYLVSNAKLESLGFAAVHTIDDGVRELIKGIPTLVARRYANA